VSANAAAQPAAPAPAPAAAPKAPAAPVNATMGEYKAPATVADTAQPRVVDHTARAVAAAREAARQESIAANGQATTPAPSAEVKPSTPAPGGEAQPGEAGKDGEAKPGEKPPRADTVTARIADLTRRNRELEAQTREANARATSVEQALVEAKKGGVQLEAIKAAFKADPLGALDQLGEKWSDIVARVAAGGLPPTPEQVAAAEKERVENERDARLKRLEEAKEAEEKLLADRTAQQQREGARNYIVSKLLSPEKHPHLVDIASDAAEEALVQVDEAMKLAGRKGPRDLDESIALTTLALDGLNQYYSELHRRISPKVPGAKPPEQPGAAGTTQAAPAAPAGTSETTASQQRRPVNTITNAVAGETPTAAQPERLDADAARAKAIAAARRLPAL